MKDKIYSFQTTNKIVIGKGTVNTIGKEVRILGAQKVLLILDKGISELDCTENIKNNLTYEGLDFVIYDKIEPEPTVKSIEECFNELKDHSFDLIIGVGGGSTMDTAKLIAVKFSNYESIRDFIGTDKIKKLGLPTILVPTTAGTGSEVTPNAIVCFEEDNCKKGIVSQYLYARAAIIDPLMTISLSPKITAYTGIDALIHAIESFISLNSNRMSDMFALKSMELISKNIKCAFKDGENVEAREFMILGSMFGGMALSLAGTAGVHALAYPLGGKFKIAHGVANSLLLPYVLEFNRDAITGELVQMAHEMSLDTDRAEHNEIAQSTIEFIKELTRDLEIPQKMSEFGVKRSDLDELTNEALKSERLIKNNPKKLGKEEIKMIYERAL